MAINFLVLIVVVFLALYLLGTVHLHCPYWQLPLGVSFFIFAIVGSFVVPLEWFDVLLGWLAGGIPAVLLSMRWHSDYPSGKK